MAFDLQFVDSIGQIYDPITDTFTRTVSNGWGTSDTGQVWSTSGGSASDFSVDGTRGLQSLDSANVLRNSLIDVGSTDGTITVDIINPVVPTGASITHWVLMRAADLSNYYVARLDIPTGAGATLALHKRVGGTLTGLTSSVSVGLHAAPTKWRVVFDVNGSTLRAKAWRSDLVAEPAGWQVAATDTDLTSGTQGGMLARLETGNTNTLPVVIVYDNFSVTSPTQVRLDLNDDLPWRTLGEGTEFGTPPLRRAVVSTLMQDGEHIPAAAYGNRMLTLTLDCQLAATDFDGAAAAFQELSRELDRPGNFVRYRPGTTQPVFFRTMRSDFTSVVWDAFQRRASVSVLAEPFAYGLRESLPTTTVSNDPAAVSNGMFFDVTGVKGDVETPLYLTADAAGVVFGTIDHRRKTAIAVRRRGTPSQAPFVLQAESMTPETDTAVSSAAAGASGGSHMRTTFASSTSLTGRFQNAGLYPSSPSVDLRGTYRVYVRVSQTVASDVIAIRLVWGPTVNINDTVTLPTSASTSWKYVDLGLIQIPLGYIDTEDGVSGGETLSGGTHLSLHAQRVSGTGSLDSDVILFLPADDRLLLLTWPDVAAPLAGAASFVVDSNRGEVYGLGASGERFPSRLVEPEGRFPMISPAVTNRIYLARDVGWETSGVGGASGAGDDITGAVTVGAYYWPRYLTTRPLSS